MNETERVLWSLQLGTPCRVASIFTAPTVEFPIDNFLGTSGGHCKNERPGDCGCEPPHFHTSPLFFLHTAHSQGEHQAAQPNS